MQECGTIKCRKCEWSTPVRVFSNGGKNTNGWERLAVHMETHGIRVNERALLAIGTCDDKDIGLHSPDPGVPIGHRSRREPTDQDELDRRIITNFGVSDYTYGESENDGVDF